MDAIKFLKEKDRMCNHYSDNDMRNLCPCSEQYDNPNYCGADCNNMEYEKLVAIVDYWSGNHPVMTNRTKFKEVFGFDIKVGNCPLVDSGECLTLKIHGKDAMCNHRPWWDEPYEAKGEKNE